MPPLDDQGQEYYGHLRDQYPAPHPSFRRISGRRISAAGFIHVPLTVPDELAEDYPSHLHINLMPRLQSQGLGRPLMNTLIRALRE